MIDRWYKAPVACVFDVKVARMPATLFRAWHQFMALASLNGGALPDVAQIAYAVHSAVETVVKRLHALAERGLAVLADGVWGLVDAVAKGGKDAGEEEPLTGAERTRRWRERNGGDMTPGDEAVTPCDAQRREDKKRFLPRVTDRHGATVTRETGVWISQDAESWPAWAAWWRARHGRSPPTDRQGGWRFPSRTPPDTPAESTMAVAAE